MNNKICHCCGNPINDNYKLLCKDCREGNAVDSVRLPTKTEQQVADYYDRIRADLVANLLTR